MNTNDRIKEVRKMHGLTQHEYGTRLGITNGAVSMIERNVNQVTEQTIRAVCSEFGISREWLLDGTEPMFEADKPESAEALIPELVETLSDYPVLLHELSKAIKVMTDSDWKAFNDFV